MARIPLRRPTILTGRNDSGKSATLDALALLLGERAVSDSDFPPADDTNGVEGGSPIVVSGEVLLDDGDRSATGLPEKARLRRVATPGVARASYEVEQMVPEDLRLRDLEFMSLTQLKETAAALRLAPDGPAIAKESFLRVLRPVAASGPQCLDWVRASDEVAKRLPKFLRLSGVDAADTSAQLLAALKFTYRRILASERFTEQVEQLQGASEAALAGEIFDLSALIQERCDGLTDVSIQPHVSFRDALSGVQVFARRDGRQIDFDQVGTGRRRQLVLPVPDGDRSSALFSTVLDPVEKSALHDGVPGPHPSEGEEGPARLHLDPGPCQQPRLAARDLVQVKHPRAVDDQTVIVRRVQFPPGHRVSHCAQGQGLGRFHGHHLPGSPSLITTRAVQPDVAQPRLQKGREELSGAGIFSLQGIPAVPAAPAVAHLRDPGPYLGQGCIDGHSPGRLPDGMGNKIIPGKGQALLLGSASRTQQAGMNQPVQKLCHVLNCAADARTPHIAQDFHEHHRSHPRSAWALAARARSIPRTPSASPLLIPLWLWLRPAVRVQGPGPARPHEPWTRLYPSALTGPSRWPRASAAAPSPWPQTR